MEIYFGTTNEGKLKEAGETLGIKVVGTPLEVNEMQSLDPLKVASQKARDYFAGLKKAVLVEDVALIFKALGNLPGTYINDFSKTLGNDGLIKLLSPFENKAAVAITTLAFAKKGGEIVTFQGTVEGRIANKPLGNMGFGWDPIFIPEGSTKTFGEMELAEKNRYSMRARALREFKKWLAEAS